MKFQVNRDVLSEAVSFVVKLMPARTNHPVLGGILFEAHESSVVLSSFDYEVSATTRVAANVSTPGRMLVSGRLLAEISNRLPDAPVDIELADARVELRCGKAAFTLLSMPIEEYPSIPVVTGASGVVPADVFADAIGQVGVAASREDVTPVITGVLLEASGTNLNLVATDRFRVAVRTVEWESEGGADNLTALVPVRIVSEVSKTFASDGVVTITFSTEGERKIIAFSADDKTVTSVLLRGEYPPIQRLFPEQPVEHYAVVNTAELIEAVRRVRLVLEKDIAITFTFDSQGVTLEGVGGEMARARESVDATLTGENMVISLKPGFLLDGLQALHSEFARLSFTPGSAAQQAQSPKKAGPVLITRQTSVSDADSSSFKYLLQPNLLMR